MSSGSMSSGAVRRTTPGGARVCLLHISKTSGTSVNLFLESQFDAAEVCPARSGEEFAALGPAKLRDFSMFRAECDASVLDLLPPATSVVTLLRDPLARAHSHWRYIQRLPEHRLHEQFQRERGTFQHFLASVPANAMARLLAAQAGASPRGLWEQSDTWSDDELLNRAVARLESFAVVGIAERHDESVAQIAHHFGWAPPGRLPVTNAAPPAWGGSRVSRADQAEFEGRNSVDTALYRLTEAMFARRSRIADPPTRAALYERRLASDACVLTQRLVVDLCSPFQGSGWLRVVDTSLGRMRPIGVGGHASVDLPVILGRFTKLEVLCPAASSERALESLVIAVNGVPVALVTRPDRDGVTFEAALPPSAAADRFTRITFRTAGGVAVPPNHTGAVSNMDATIALRRMELIPYEPGSLRISPRRGAGGTP